MKARIAYVFVWAMLVAHASVADARSSRAEVRKTIESTMLVTGAIEVEKDGSVHGYQLDQPEKLPLAVKSIIAKAVPRLRFEPVKVDGRIVRARSRMGVRVIAQKLEGDHYQLRIGSLSFADAEQEAANKYIPNKQKQLKPPTYPEEAYLRNIAGTVYMLVRVNADGDVATAEVEQTNLTVLGNEREMKEARELLERASLSAARRWKLNPLTSEDLDKEGLMTVRVPVTFELFEQKRPSYGQWEAYVPGPRNRPSWLKASDAMQSPDAMIAGMQYSVGAGLKLLTPPGEG